MSLGGSSTICFRVTKKERYLLEVVAHRRGDTLSELIRAATFDVAREELDANGRATLVESYEAHRKKKQAEEKASSRL